MANSDNFENDRYAQRLLSQEEWERGGSLSIPTYLTESALELSEYDLDYIRTTQVYQEIGGSLFDRIHIVGAMKSNNATDKRKQPTGITVHHLPVFDEPPSADDTKDLEEKRFKETNQAAIRAIGKIAAEYAPSPKLPSRRLRTGATRLISTAISTGSAYSIAEHAQTTNYPLVGYGLAVVAFLGLSHEGHRATKAVKQSTLASISHKKTSAEVKRNRLIKRLEEDVVVITRRQPISADPRGA